MRKIDKKRKKDTERKGVTEREREEDTQIDRLND